MLVAVLVGHDNVGPPFFVLVLAAFSVNRFLLAGLSASLPHVVDRDLLVTANSVVPTCGSIAYLSGLGAGGALHALTDSDPSVIATASVLYLLSSGVAICCRSSAPTSRRPATPSARPSATSSRGSSTPPGTCRDWPGWPSPSSRRPASPTG